MVFVQPRHITTMRETRIPAQTFGLRRWMTIAGGAGLIAMAAITAACGSNENEQPTPSSTTTTTATTTTTTTATSPATVAPTEKGLTPDGGNSFGPQVIAPAAPTEPPGVHRHRAQ
jgi:hypothetical protein